MAIQKKLQTRKDQILQAAERTFAQKGYQEATISDVAREAKVSDATIYEYFTSKEELLFLIPGATARRGKENLEHVLRFIRSSADKIRAFIYDHLNFYQNHPDYASVSMLILKPNRKFLETEAYKDVQELSRILLQVIKEGMARGEFRSEIDPYLVRSAILGTIEHQVTRQVLLGKPENLVGIDRSPYRVDRRRDQGPGGDQGLELQYRLGRRRNKRRGPKRFRQQASGFKEEEMKMETRPWQRHYDYEVPVSLRYPRIPAQDFLHYAANGFPDKAAYNFYGTEMSFYDLRRQVLRLANALGELGVQKGDRVGLHLPTCPQYVIAYYAALSLGAIGVNLNPMYTAEELKRIVADTGITTLITFDMVLPNIVQVCQAVAIPRVVVTRITDYIQGMPQSTPAELGLPEGWHHFSQLIENCTQTRVPRVSILPEDPGLDSIYRRDDRDSQGGRPDPREYRGRHDPGLGLGKADHGDHPAGAAVGTGRPALFPCLRDHRLHELGRQQLRHPVSDSPL